jgi:hypothetical protein
MSVRVETATGSGLQPRKASPDAAAALHPTTEIMRMHRVSLRTKRLDYWAAHRAWPWGFAIFWFALGVLSLIFSDTGSWAWVSGSWVVSVVWVAMGLAVERRIYLKRYAGISRS